MTEESPIKGLESLEKKGLIKYDIKSEKDGSVEMAGQYDPVEDIVRLNPDLLDVPTIAEEFYHRKQLRILKSKGIPFDLRESQLYLTANEVGIIPRIRSIGKKHGTSEADYEFFRYLIEAKKFLREMKKAAVDERNQFLKAVEGEKLYDGLGWVLKHQDLSFDELERIAVKDSSGKNYWKEIEKEGKEWTRGQR